jgi:hypothetical protein
MLREGKPRHREVKCMHSIELDTLEESNNKWIAVIVVPKLSQGLFACCQAPKPAGGWIS